MTASPECGRLSTFSELPECWNGADGGARLEIQNMLLDIIEELCGSNQIGCGLERTDDLHVKVDGTWGEGEFGDYSIGSEAYGAGVVCHPTRGLITHPLGTSNFASASNGMILSGTFTGTGAEVVIPGSTLTAFLTLNNPSMARKMNIFMNFGARLGVALPVPPSSANSAYVGLQIRVNGGAWVLAQAVYSDQLYLPVGLQDNTHALSSNATVAQIAAGGTLVVDIRGVYYSVTGVTTGYDFALPNGVALGASA